MLIIYISTWQGIAVTRDGLFNEAHPEMCQDIIVDSVISQSRRVDLERELQPWVPAEDDPQCPELENIFDETWNRCLLSNFFKEESPSIVTRGGAISSQKQKAWVL